MTLLTTLGLTLTLTASPTWATTAPESLDAPRSAARQPAASATPAAQVEAPVPVLDWQPCNEGSEVMCASPAVPLDYDEPTGPTVQLDVVKVPASDPDSRIGSLFVNPGGPGGSAAELARDFRFLVRRRVSARFDIIGVDPRGVGSRVRMECTNPDPVVFRKPVFPLEKWQSTSIIASDRWFRSGCREEPSEIVAHMTTADTARDMDLIRQALGEEQLTYYGVSYGSYLGATYAAMFPDRIRAMIVDGVLDPIAWSTGRGDSALTNPFSKRVNSGQGSWQALTSAFAECDRVGKRRCALAGRSTEKWTAVVQRLRKGPVRVDGGRLTYQEVISVTRAFLYAPAIYPLLMRILDELHEQIFRDPSGRLVARQSDWTLQRVRQASGRRDLPGPYGWARYGRAFVGVACADTDNPSQPWAWWDASVQADRRTPWFGKPWTWASSTCASWPELTKEDRFTGPWFRTTSAPVLIVGNSYDPATPLHGAQALNRMLGGSRLLVLEGWGHGAIGSGACVDEIYRDYLLAGALPAAGKVCRPDDRLFP